MTAVDIFKASRMKQIEDTTVVSGLVDSSGHLFLSTRAGESIDAGNVTGPIGPGFQNRGAWMANTDYNVRDVVTSNGSTFVVLTAHTSSTTAPTAEVPGSNLAVWAQRGTGYTYQGAWAPSTAYAARDVVTSGGSTFLVTTAHTSSTTAPTPAAPGTNLSLWAQKGTDGTIGADGSPAIPAGTISLWGSDTAPANWLICDGAAVSRTTYASLFATIGTKYGAGDGVNTFNLPNLKGRTPIGKDAAQTEFAAIAQVGGEKTHKLTSLETGLRDHTHVLPMGTISGVGGTLDIPARASGTSGTVDGGFRTGRPADNTLGTNGAGTYGNATLSGTANMDAVNAHNILQPYSVVNFIIKVTNGDTPGDSQLTQRVNNLETFASNAAAGTITIFGGTTPPTNWFLCDGAAVSRSTYASLFAAIGTTYGAGDGVTTFNLPNLKGRIPVGRDAAQTEFAALAQTGGEKTHLLTATEMPAHSHAQNVSANPGQAGGTSLRIDYTSDGVGGIYSQGINTQNAGGGAAHNVLQPYLTVNYIIKFTNGDTLGDSQLTQRVNALEAIVTTQALSLRDKMHRAQRVMTGGGTRKVAVTGISWNQRFIIIGQGWEDPALAGYWDIAFPPNGTVIPVYGSTTATSSIVANSEIPMNGWYALYYDIPLNGDFTSDPSRFKMVGYQSKLTFTPPPTWVMICARNTDAGHAAYTWGDGRTQDYWRAFTPGNGWTQFSNYSPIGWKWKADGSIQLRGLMAGGTQGTVVADWGVALAPEKNSIFVGYSNTATARLDVSDVGTLIVNGYTAGGSNAWVSLENVNWFPKGS